MSIAKELGSALRDIDVSGIPYDSTHYVELYESTLGLAVAVFDRPWVWNYTLCEIREGEDIENISDIIDSFMASVANAEDPQHEEAKHLISRYKEGEEIILM